MLVVVTWCEGSKLHSTDKTSLETKLVDFVYTFGAPATSKEAFSNKARTDGCFPGLRTYTEDASESGWKTWWWGSTQKKKVTNVDFAVPSKKLNHARTASLVLYANTKSYYTPCDATSHGHHDWPVWGRSELNITLHNHNNYDIRLDKLSLDGKKKKDEPFKSAISLSTFAFKGYKGSVKINKAASTSSGWMLVPESHQMRKDKRTSGKKDPLFLLKNRKDNGCALVLTGTTSDNSRNPINDIAGLESHPQTYCGFKDVQAFYAKEMIALTSDTAWANMKDKLKGCKRVSCVGHSIGGALCEILAACANSGKKTNEHFQNLVWKAT